jgi:hypothetical protein
MLHVATWNSWLEKFMGMLMLNQSWYELDTKDMMTIVRVLKQLTQTLQKRTA